MRLTLCLTLVIGLLQCTSIMAQKYSPGYVVRIQGDTVRGEIRSRNWDKTPAEFSMMNDGIETAYTANEVKAFQVGDLVFESHTVDVEISPIKVEYLDWTPEPKTEKRTIFLQLLFDGKTPLYTHKDTEGKVHFFARNKEGVVQLLLYKKYYKYVKDYMSTRLVKSMMFNERFKGQLIDMFRECPTITRQIEQAKYEQGSLTKVFQSYAGCTGERTEARKVAKRYIFYLRAYAGASMNEVSFVGENLIFDGLEGASFSGTTAPLVGLSLIIETKAPDLIFFGGLRYTSISTSGRYESSSTPYVEDYTFKTGIVNARLGAGIKPIRSLPGLYVHAAGLVDFYTGDKFTWVQTYNGSNPISEAREFPETMIGSGLGFAGSIGYSTRKLGLELSYDKIGDFSPGTSIKSSISRIGITLSYNITQTSK